MAWALMRQFAKGLKRHSRASVTWVMLESSSGDTTLSALGGASLPEGERFFSSSFSLTLKTRIKIQLVVRYHSTEIATVFF